MARNEHHDGAPVVTAGGSGEPARVPGGEPTGAARGGAAAAGSAEPDAAAACANGTRPGPAPDAASEQAGGADEQATGRSHAGGWHFHTASAISGAILLLLGAALAALVVARPGHSPPFAADRNWLNVIMHAREPFLTTAAKVVSLAGGPGGGTVIVVVAGAFLWLARKRRASAVFLVAIVPLTSGASQLIKHLVLRPRPPHALVPADAGSFPSGHVISTLAVGFALALVLGRPGQRAIPFLAAGGATVVMILCRTYLAAHWLSDTLESVLVAGGLVLVAWAVAGGMVEKESGSAADDEAVAPARRG